MAFWTDKFLGKIRTDWLNRIYKIQYQSNSGTWYDAAITEKKITGNKIQLKCTTTDDVAMTIKAIRLIDNAGDVAGQLTENITKLATQGVITVWEFPIYEIQGSQ